MNEIKINEKRWFKPRSRHNIKLLAEILEFLLKFILPLQKFVFLIYGQFVCNLIKPNQYLP